eukprot:CAMPEP_0115841312 /NCGR_PEP_ID=MMETSP0287-20121206/7224_1 /TAXON_ID=412157 /ORGANISM="Chrysochromulina rotalis, Strain UIO044" /LENGTH=271 /DNA_ID=CAMNT_0003294955 /DNA_START=92 /DNA_END=907 /DNA_ORIENTATION=-
MTSQTFILGACIGLAFSWLFNELQLALFARKETPTISLSPVPFEPPEIEGYHAIIIPAGGQTEDGPPAHVLARLERAVHLYQLSSEPKPYVITTAWGTPHKPCPHDAAGFERHEAQDNAKYLMTHGVDPARILEESVSLETVGNAYFARVLHTDVRGLRKLAVVNNHFHIERTRAVFGHVFRVPPLDGQPDAAYEIDFVEVEDRLAQDVLEIRKKKELAAVPKFARGGPWQEATPTLRELHDWVHQENTAYASRRLLTERQPLDPELLKSY